MIFIYQVIAVLLYKTKPYPNIQRHKDEDTFLDPQTIQTIAFPSLDDPPTLELSVIVPAYNEEKRCKSHLPKKFSRISPALPP